MQHTSIQKTTKKPAIPPRHLHNSSRRPMEVDSLSVRSRISPLLATLRRHLVANLLHTRRPRAPPSTSLPRWRKFHALCHKHLRLHLLLLVQHRNATHDWLRWQNDHWGVSRSYFPGVLPEYYRGYDSVVFWRYCLREDDEAQTKNADAVVLEECSGLPEGWAFVFDVQSWRYEEESYYWSQYSSAVDSAEDNERRRGNNICIILSKCIVLMPNIFLCKTQDLLHHFMEQTRQLFTWNTFYVNNCFISFKNWADCIFNYKKRCEFYQWNLSQNILFYSFVRWNLHINILSIYSMYWLLFLIFMQQGYIKKQVITKRKKILIKNSVSLQ